MEKELLSVLNQIESRALWLLIKLMAAGILVMIVKSYLQRIAAYVQFSTNKQLGVGRHVKVRGMTGVIKWYNTRFIFVDTEEGQELIPIGRWIYEKWTVLNGGKKDE